MNRHEEFLRLARRVTEKASTLPTVEGVMLLGGLARGYCDDFSDLDIIIVASELDLGETRKAFEEMARRLERESGIETDIEVHSFDGFYAQEWGEIERSSFKGCLIDFDRNGRIGRAIQEKLSVPNEFWRRRVVEGCTYLSWYACPEPPHPSIAELWVRRGDLVQAHWCVSHAVELSVELVYALNREFLPPAKWRLFNLRGLRWLPEGMMERLQEMLRVAAFDEVELERRLKAVRALWPHLLRRAEASESLDQEGIKRYYLERMVYSQE